VFRRERSLAFEPSASLIARSNGRHASFFCLPKPGRQGWWFDMHLEILGIMSDLSITLEALQRSRTQLPVSSYFDQALFDKEMRQIFPSGPRYLGHERMVPEVGDYQALANEGEGRALVRTAQGVELVSNVCRHRQAVMLKGRGNTGSNVVCPLHRWTYGLDGQLIGAPHFKEDPCLNLRNYPVQIWNGLVFEANVDGQGRDVAADLAGLGPRAELDFEGYVFDKVIQHECNYNWKTFIEVYLEDYHVGPFHPGLGRFLVRLAAATTALQRGGGSGHGAVLQEIASIHGFL